MRKVWAGVLLLSLMVVGSVISTHNVSAYFKDNCYATQYEEIVNLKGDDKIPSRNVYSSDSVCYSNGSLSVKDRPNKKSTMGIGLPAIKHLGRTTPRYKIDGKKVVLTYCPNGRMVCAGNGKEKSFSLDDYGGDFEKLARDMDSFIAGLGNPKDCTKLDFGKNDVEGGIITASDGDASGSGTTEGGDDGETAYAGDACYNANTNSQGWILCPTMRNLEYTAGSMDNILERWLSVDTNLYDASSPTAVVWEVMRNIANVIMVVIMLVIIFSQLTGVGIDNYGIKKMLPRLIAMAILINLSLVICELAIDLSNLLGTGLRNLFGAIGQGILEGRDAGDYVETFISTMVSVVMVAAGVVGAVAPTALTVHSIGAAGGASTAMIVTVIVLVLLVVFAAIAVFFVMLAARMIIIIGCVALAPVAFALYILPNTQGLFKKWFTAFKTALVVFPICGAVSGISYIIKGIVLTADEIHIWMGVVGMMAPFLVFFMLPSLLRGVLGTLDKVGDALTTMGNRVQSGARGISSAVQSSEAYQDNLKRAQRRSAALRGGRTVNRLDRISGGNRGSLSQAQQARLLRAERARSSYNTQEAKDFSDLYEGMDFGQLMLEAGYSKDNNGNWHAGKVSWANDTNADARMSSLVKTMGSRGMEDQMFDMLASNDVGSMTRQALAASDNKVAKAFGKAGSGQSFSQYMTDPNNGLKKYVENKGNDFVTGLDDKALNQIEKYSNANNQIMDSNLIGEAQAKLNDKNSVDILDRMASNAPVANITGSQLANWNYSSVDGLVTRVNKGDQAALNSLLAASDTIAGDPNLPSQMNPQAKARVNAVRQQFGSKLIP